MKVRSLILMLLILSSCSPNNEQAKESIKVGVVQVPRLYKEFKYHKEIKAEMQEKAQILSAQRDSLKFMYLSLEEKLNSKANVTKDEKDRLSRLRNSLMEIQDKIQNGLQAESQKYDENITNQLNSYISQFGKEKGYDIIHGHFEGNVLYSKEQYDITNDLIEFVNKKYQNE